MLPKLEIRYDELEAKRQRLVDILGGFSLSELNFSPKDMVWSPLQVTQHISNAENLSIQYVSKKINAIDLLSHSGWMENIKMHALKTVLQSSLKTKAPVKTSPTHSNLDLNVLSDWETTRLELRALLERFDEDSVTKKVYKHVFVGRIDICQMMDFFDAHFEHHRKQIISRLPTH